MNNTENKTNTITETYRTTGDLIMAYDSLPANVKADINLADWALAEIHEHFTINTLDGFDMSSTESFLSAFTLTENPHILLLDFTLVASNREQRLLLVYANQQEVAEEA